MSTLLVPAYAKINLTLEVLRRLPSGYHELASVMQEVSLQDEVYLELSMDREIHLICNDKSVPISERNLAWQAAERLRHFCAKPSGAKITLFKRIPVGGGMGGGSADAAAVLRGLNQLWELNLDTQALQTLAQDIGMDVPFCIQGGTALATGRGEIVIPLPPAPRLDLVIAHPGIGVSTAEAYQSLNLNRTVKLVEAKRMRDALTSGNARVISQCLYNDFELPISRRVPAITRLKQIMLEHGALGTLMCGSGSGVFGIAESPEQAQRIAAVLSSVVPFVAVGQTQQRNNPIATSQTLTHRSLENVPNSSI